MGKLNNTNNYSLIAAICFFAYGVINIIRKIHFSKIYNSFELTFWMALSWAVLFALAAFLFIGKKNIGLLVVTSIYSMLVLRYMIQFFSLHTAVHFSVRALTVIAILLVMKQSSVIKSIWFIPAPMLLLSDITYWIQYDLLKDFLETVPYFVLQLLEVAGLFFIALWLREEAKEFTDAQMCIPRANEDTIVKQYPVSNRLTNSVIGEADKLRTYKELLDLGIITQGEFDTKKKEIINL